MAHAITIGDLVYVFFGIVGLMILFVVVVIARTDDWIGCLRHRYIRTGEKLYTINGWSKGAEANPKYCGHVTVTEWGQYAAVRIGDGPAYIRRDGIHWDEKKGYWCYRYDE